MRSMLGTVRAQMKLQHLAVLCLPSKVPPAISATHLERPVTLRVAKRKAEVHLPEHPESEELRRRTMEAQAGTKQSLALPPAPKAEDAVDQARALAEAVPNPEMGLEVTPEGQKKPASEVR